MLCVDIGARVVEAMSFGPHTVGERTLADRMRPGLSEGSVVLMDRNLTSYSFLWDLKRQGLDFVVRAKHKMKAELLHALGPGDFVVRITLPRQLRRARPDLPKHGTLREIVFDGRGARDPLRLFTTLLSPSVTAGEIDALYLRRWDEETTNDELKTHLGDAATVNRPLVLRSRNPQRVAQELHGLRIAYNAVRRLMVNSGGTSVPRIDPLRLSFTAALERLREAIRDIARPPAYLLPERHAQLLQAVARGVVPDRPGRSCPRAVCVKMSSYAQKEKLRAG